MSSFFTNKIEYTKSVFLLTVMTIVSFNTYSQEFKVNGNVKDTSGESLIGVNVIEKGTSNGTVTDFNGDFTLEVSNNNSILALTYIGFDSINVEINGRSRISITMVESTSQLDEVIVVGYGSQKKSDITGAVASVGSERLEFVPNLNIAQAIQGAVPGVTIQTSSGGSTSNENIMIRGRNSIQASNQPLIVVDGVPYGGQIRDINPSDVKSIEILKDASSASIYGSRGSNGVILVTTKEGLEGKPKVAYNGYYSIQEFTKIPDIMNGEEFYKFKMEREPEEFTESELNIYEAGEWVNWLDLALRNGSSTRHDLSISGGSSFANYYISAGITDVKGLALNDDYLRITSRINLDIKITDWLSIGTRTQLSYDDRGGLSPTWDGDQGVFWMNPLTKAYNDDGTLTVFPWDDNPYFRNPLMGTLAKNLDESYQVISNNFAIVDFPFIQGLQYRINTGVRFRFTDTGTYYGRDTQVGLKDGGSAATNRGRYDNNVIENILNYNRTFDKHGIFLTALYSFEKTTSSDNLLDASGFPHDFLTWYSSAQANLIEPDFTYSSNALISQMLRVNYSFDSRYLLTATSRRDGYSGFGADSKWGVFPSIALGWNIANESFFVPKNIFNALKIRLSYGLNGNQSIGAYQTISRLSENNYVTESTTLPGYIPFKLGENNLGWESSTTLNGGIDFGLFSNRIFGDINIYKTNTYDLLLNRSIPSIHGIGSITQNIGEIENVGFEASVTSRNITKKDFSWTTNANFSWLKNKIVSLYGILNEDGQEVDDVANQWFLGEPIRVNYGFMWDGVWQTDEVEEAAIYGTQPGFVKIKDINNDSTINDQDRMIIGQRDPKFTWGLNNSIRYKNLSLSVFMHGVHGITKNNTLKSDNVYSGVQRNTTKKNWWTPENPTNDWYMNHVDAHRMQGVSANNYENASFIRIKDITLSYSFEKSLLENIGIDNLQIYFTGRNMFTITNWEGLDPELDSQRNIPLQKEYVIGLNLGF